MFERKSASEHPEAPPSKLRKIEETKSSSIGSEVIATDEVTNILKEAKLDSSDNIEKANLFKNSSIISLSFILMELRKEDALNQENLNALYSNPSLAFKRYKVLIDLSRIKKNWPSFFTSGDTIHPLGTHQDLPSIIIKYLV